MDAGCERELAVSKTRTLKIIEVCITSGQVFHSNIQICKKGLNIRIYWEIISSVTYI